MLKRALLAVLLLALPLAVSVRAGHIDLLVNFDGTLDTEWAAGDKPDTGATLPSPWARCTIDAGTLPFDAADNRVEFDDATDVFTVDSVGGSIPLGVEDHIDGPCLTIASADDAILISRLTGETLVGGTLSATGWAIRDTNDPGSIYTSFLKTSASGSRIRERTTLDGSAVNVNPSPHTNDLGTQNFWEMARLDRETSSIRYYAFQGASNPGTNPAANWEFIREVNHAFLGSGDILAMLVTSPIDNAGNGNQIITTWDNVSHDFATELDHSVGTVGFDPVTYETDEDTTPVTLTVTRTGSGAGVLDLTATFVNGTAEAGVDFTLPSCNFDYGNGVTGDKTCDVTIINRSAVQQGESVFTVVLTKNSGSDTLQNATATVTINDLTGAALAWPEMSPGDNEVVRGYAGWANFTPLLNTNPSYEFVEIRNTNTSGAGSFDACVSGNSSPTVIRFCIPVISGIVNYDGAESTKTKVITRSNLVLPFHLAPDPGFHIQGLSWHFKGSYILLMHPSCFSQGTNQANADCFEFNGVGVTGGAHDIVMINAGGVFGGDGAINVFRNVKRIDIWHGMWPYPTKVPGPGIADGTLRQAPGLIGYHDVNVTTFDQLYAFSIGSHGSHRCPKIQDSAIAFSNICFDQATAYMTLDPHDRPGAEYMVLHNLFIRGNSNNNNPTPLRLGELVGNVKVDFDVYFEGNQAFGAPMNDSTETSLVDDNSQGHATIVGSPIASQIPTGVEYLPIASTAAADEEEWALFVCAGAGPRPASRLAIYQQLCDEIQAEFNGQDSGDFINIIADHDLGIPNVPVNGPCDPEVANSCGPGFSALDYDNPKQAGSFIDATWTTIMDAHCIRTVPGAIGCP